MSLSIRPTRTLTAKSGFLALFGFRCRKHRDIATLVFEGIFFQTQETQRLKKFGAGGCGEIPTIIVADVLRFAYMKCIVCDKRDDKPREVIREYIVCVVCARADIPYPLSAVYRLRFWQNLTEAI